MILASLAKPASYGALMDSDIRERELENCRPRRQFNDGNEIIELLKTHTYKEVADKYGISPTTVINRLKRLNLYKTNKNY